MYLTVARYRLYASRNSSDKFMKLIESLLGCIMAIISLVILSFCIFVFAIIGKELYKQTRVQLAREARKLRIRRKVVRRRYTVLSKQVRRWWDIILDSFFISSKLIAVNTTKFLLIWSLPAIFILSIVAISFKEHESILDEKSRVLEMQQREIELKVKEYSVEKEIDSLAAMKKNVTPDSLKRN